MVLLLTSRTYSIDNHVSEEAKLIESLTEARLRSRARAIQLALTVFKASKIKGNAEGNVAGSG